MKLGVFSVLFYDRDFEQMLDDVAAAGLDMIEVGTGAIQEINFVTLMHC